MAKVCLRGKDIFLVKDEGKCRQWDPLKGTYKPRKVLEAGKCDVTRGFERQIALVCKPTVLKSSETVVRPLAGKVEELVAQARNIVSGDDHSRQTLWRAYVAIEYAILDLKLRGRIEGASPPAKPSRKVVDLALAKKLLDKIDTTTAVSDERKLLYDLRACRDVLKALVAGYDRRSTTS